MRIFFFVFTFILVAPSLAQINVIKVKKEQSLIRVTLADLDTGTILLNKILENKKLTIINNQDDVTIYRYDAIITNEAGSRVFLGKSEKLSKAILKELQKIDFNKPIQLRIFNIVAFNNLKETIPLNDIKISILK